MPTETDILRRRPAMRHRVVGILAGIIAAIVVFGQSGCSSSTGSSRMAHVTQWESGLPAHLTGIELDRHIYGFHASTDFIWLVPDRDDWSGRNRVLKVDPRTLEIVAAIPLPLPLNVSTSRTSALDVGEGAVWVAGGRDWLWALFSKSTLFRIDSVTNQLAAEIPLEGFSEGIAIGEGAVWVGTGKTVTRIDPKTNAVVARIPVGRDTWDRISVGAGSIWVLKMVDAMLYRIDPATNQVVAEIRVGPSQRERRQGQGWGFSPELLIYSGGAAMLLAMPLLNKLPTDEGYYSLQLDWLHFPSLTATTDAVWVLEATNYERITPSTAPWHVLRIDPGTNEVIAKIPLRGRPYAVTIYQGFPWVSVRSGINTPCYLIKIDPKTNEVVDRLEFPPEPYCTQWDTVQLGGGLDAIWALRPAGTGVVRSRGPGGLWRIEFPPD
jgi:DNA-binding beta-propeller fold protein YncE